ncbi:NUDIX hydrolase [Rhodobacter ferrooxidans]|uniref:NUDIX hydrolase n=1 Tax=Rhodobacter ferrooxidans TaxID=371731 RepID=UPI0006822F2F|nr:NUDIX hydrolase [Rhodobacter sp. SW2]
MDSSVSPATAPEAVPQAQVGALCWRRIGKRLEVLLITSRDTGRWVIPKGWPIAGLTAADSAAREAFEEAGVEGKALGDCIGRYGYLKMLAPQDGLACEVAVYPLQVKALRDRFPESQQRRRKWFTPRKAARKVAEPDLQGLLDGLEQLLSPALPAAKTAKA